MGHNYGSLSALEPVLHNKRSYCNEKPEHHKEEQPQLTTRESPCKATKTQHSQRKENIEKRSYTKQQLRTKEKRGPKDMIVEIKTEYTGSAKKMNIYLFIYIKKIYIYINSYGFS